MSTRLTQKQLKAWAMQNRTLPRDPTWPPRTRPLQDPFSPGHQYTRGALDRAVARKRERRRRKGRGAMKEGRMTQKQLEKYARRLEAATRDHWGGRGRQYARPVKPEATKLPTRPVKPGGPRVIWESPVEPGRSSKSPRGPAMKEHVPGHKRHALNMKFKGAQGELMKKVVKQSPWGPLTRAAGRLAGRASLPLAAATGAWTIKEALQAGHGAYQAYQHQRDTEEASKKFIEKKKKRRIRSSGYRNAQSQLEKLDEEGY